MSEIAFEYLALAPEATRGTAIATPTHRLNLAGTMTPNQTRARPTASNGTLAEFQRSKTVKRWAEWEASGGLDPRELLLLATMTLNGNPPAATVVQAGSVWLHTFTRTITSDNLDSGTIWFGDPNMGTVARSSYSMINQLQLTADASGDEMVQLSVQGQGRFPERVTPPTLPANVLGPMFAPSEMQIWIDTTSAIGTTAIEGRVISADATMPTGTTYKWLASGPSGNLTYTTTGRTKSHPSLTLVFEFEDLAQYNLYADNNGDTVARIRVRFNGPVISGAHRHFAEIDIYGPLDALAWGEHEGSNRTLELTVQGEEQSSIGSDLVLRVQTNTATI